MGLGGRHGVIGHDAMAPVQFSGTAPIMRLFSGDPYGMVDSLDAGAMAPNGGR